MISIYKVSRKDAVICFSCLALMMDLLGGVAVVQPQSLGDLWACGTCEGEPPIIMTQLPSVSLKKALAKSVAPPLENVMVIVCEVPAYHL